MCVSLHTVHLFLTPMPHCPPSFAFHPPSLFDDFILLHAGAVVYTGEWKDAVDYFAARGCPCPMYTNPTDHFMAVLKDKGDGLAEQWDAQVRYWLALAA